MEERPLVEVSLDALRHILTTYSPGRSQKPAIYAAIAGLVSRLEQELPGSEARLCLIGFDEHVDSTEFAIRIEKTGPGHRWTVATSPSKVFHVDERRTVCLWFMLRIEGSSGLQYCSDRKQGSPWRKADDAGIAALIAEARQIWERLETPGAERWQSDVVSVTF